MKRSGLMILTVALLAASCSGTDSADPTVTPTEAAAPGATDAPAATEAPATTPVATDAPEESRGELAPPCSYIDSDEMAAVTGTEMVAEESYGSDCFYEATAGMTAGPDVHIGLYLLPAGECPEVLQTEPLFDDESVEPVQRGDAAVLIVGTYSTEFEICHGGLYLDVAVLGDESTSAETRMAVAEAVVDLLLDRV